MAIETGPQSIPLSLGAKIRQQRKNQRLTLVQMAERCHISPSFLSQIERDQANPSVATLHTIAEVFGLPLATFFDEQPEPKSGTGVNSYQPPVETLAKVVRSNQRKLLIYPGSGIRNELLSPDLQRKIQMMRVVIPPHASMGDVPLVHEGEECGFVLQGQIEVWVGDEHYILGPGDAIYQPSTVPHHSRNISDVEAIVITAITPPSF
jgi:transcriptional regulator with XRE-family HTH domain